MKRTAWNSTLPVPTKPMARGKPLNQGGPVNPVNKDRIKKLRAKQFGNDGKREWVLSLPSVASGKYGWDGNPMTPAHVGKTRGAGAGPEMMAPLLWLEHIDFDSSMTDKRFEAKHGVSREQIREKARELHQEWKHDRGAGRLQAIQSPDARMPV